MDKTSKLLRKLSEKERVKVVRAVDRIMNGSTRGLDVKKLKGRDGEFRVRVGNVRILLAYGEAMPRIISIDRRTDTTYRP